MSWIRQFFSIGRGSILPRIAPQVLGFAIYSALIVAAMRYFAVGTAAYGVAPFTVLGVALSIYLGFRNNAAYERWWEARRLWGQLVFEIRNLARAVLLLVPEESGQIRALLMESLAFCHYLRGAVRGLDVDAECRGFVGADADVFARAINKPDAVLRSMGRRLAVLKRDHRLQGMDLRILDERLSGMAALQAGCERIFTTPLPLDLRTDAAAIGVLVLSAATVWTGVRRRLGNAVVYGPGGLFILWSACAVRGAGESLRDRHQSSGTGQSVPS
ncbi:MAG: bestrophin family ion channel [Steroidobacteraceae bacterium]